MTFTMAALVLSNLLYVAGAVVAATLLSLVYVLGRRRPKSVKSGMKSFNRELRALAPQQGPTSGRPGGPAAEGSLAGVRIRPKKGDTEDMTNGGPPG